MIVKVQIVREDGGQVNAVVTGEDRVTMGTFPAPDWLVANIGGSEQKYYESEISEDRIVHLNKELEYQGW